MPTQRSVAVRFWTSLSLQGCSPYARLVMLNCMTGPRSNIAGFFRLSLDDCCLETGLTRRQIVEALHESRQREFLEWDTQTLWVWVRKRVCFEFPDGIMSPKQLRGIVRILEDAPDIQLKSLFVDFYKGFIKGFPNGLCKPPGSGSLIPAPTPGSLIPAPTPAQDSGSVQDNPADLVAVWNEVGATTRRNGLPGFVLCKDLSPTRKSKAAARLKEAEMAWHRQVIARLGQSNFACVGSPPTKDHPKPFRASFDWYIENDTNCLKISEGKYDN